MADDAGNPFDDFKEDFALLIEAGFIAVKQLDELSASRLFNAAQVLNPKSTISKIGHGYIALNKLEMKTATKIFEEVTQEEPENYLAQSFLGICYLLNPAKRKQGEEIIRNAMEKTDDQAIKNLGKISLEWSEKDLQKGKFKSPFFADKEEEKTEKSKETEKKQATKK